MEPTGAAGGDGALRPPMHPDAKLRSKQHRRAENGGKYYNAKNSQASVYKPSDAEHIDKAEASCTKHINDLDMDSDQSGENNFDHVINLQNLDIHERGEGSGNGKYNPRIDLDRLINEIDDMKLAMSDVKRGKDKTDEKSKSRSHSSGKNSSSHNSKRRHRHEKQPPPESNIDSYSLGYYLKHRPCVGNTDNSRYNSASQHSDINNVIHLYPQPPPGKASKICVTARLVLQISNLPTFYRPLKFSATFGFMGR